MRGKKKKPFKSLQLNKRLFPAAETTLRIITFPFKILFQKTSRQIPLSWKRKNSLGKQQVWRAWIHNFGDVYGH